jgi:hypothetical protein
MTCLYVLQTLVQRVSQFKVALSFTDQWFPTFSDPRTGKRSLAVCEDRSPIYLILYSKNNGQKIKLLIARLNMFIFN